QDSMRYGPNEKTCATVRDDLTRLLSLAPENSPIANWGVDRAEACLWRASREETHQLLERLLAVAPNSVSLLNLLGRHDLLTGRAADAIPYLQRATEVSDDVDSWDMLGWARLTLAKQDKGSDKSRKFLEQAASNLAKSIELAGGTPDPWILERMAE